MRALPDLGSWGLTFLRNSKTTLFERNAGSNLQLALHSLDAMHSLTRELCIDYGGTARGTLRIFRGPNRSNGATISSTRLLGGQIRIRTLSRTEAVELEPALEPISDQLSGANYYETDETGDAHRFCVALTERGMTDQIEFQFGREVSELEFRSGAVSAVICGEERFVGDRYVVSAGSYSTDLLRGVGINLPVRPVKGYSLTVETRQEPDSLRIPVIDDHLHVVVVPLRKGVIRVAGTAEFTGFDCRLDLKRIRNLTVLLREVLPRLEFEVAAAKPWCGLRAMSADGVPLIGFTPIQNLMVNTGHGHLGWTMAAGSAKLLASLLSGDSPSINPAPYDPKRFTLA
jgi:D-amino-acid dehydrogenase